MCLGITEDRNGQDGANSHQSTQDKDAHTQHRDERIISCSPEKLDSAQDSVGRFNNTTSVPRECKHDGVLLIVASVNVAFLPACPQGHMIDMIEVWYFVPKIFQIRYGQSLHKTHYGGQEGFVWPHCSIRLPG